MRAAGALLTPYSEVQYTPHFGERRDLRDFPEGFAEMVLQTADAHYQDTESGNSIAVKRVQLRSAEREVAVVYNIRGNLLTFVSIFPLRRRQRQNNLSRERWTPHELES